MLEILVGFGVLLAFLLVAVVIFTVFWGTVWLLERVFNVQPSNSAYIAGIIYGGLIVAYIIGDAFLNH